MSGFLNEIYKEIINKVKKHDIVGNYIMEKHGNITKIKRCSDEKEIILINKKENIILITVYSKDEIGKIMENYLECKIHTTKNKRTCGYSDYITYAFHS